MAPNGPLEMVPNPFGIARPHGEVHPDPAAAIAEVSRRFQQMLFERTASAAGIVMEWDHPLRHVRISEPPVLEYRLEKRIESPARHQFVQPEIAARQDFLELPDKREIVQVLEKCEQLRRGAASFCSIGGQSPLEIRDAAIRKVSPEHSAAGARSRDEFRRPAARRFALEKHSQASGTGRFHPPDAVPGRTGAKQPDRAHAAFQPRQFALQLHLRLAYPAKVFTVCRCEGKAPLSHDGRACHPHSVVASSADRLHPSLRFGPQRGIALLAEAHPPEHCDHSVVGYGSGLRRRGGIGGRAAIPPCSDMHASPRACDAHRRRKC